MYPYEKIDLIDMSYGILDEVKKILSSGWKRGNYPAIDLQKDQIPWALPHENRLRSWNFHIHEWEMLTQFLHAHSLTDNDFYLEIPIKIILNWIDNSSDQEQPVSPMVWYDMAVGMRAYRLAYVLEAGLHAGLLDTKLENKFWESLICHAKWLQDDSHIAFHTNHGYYQAAGQMAMGRRFLERDPIMHLAWEQGEERLRRMLTQQFTDEGVHKEHSPDYHYMVYNTFKGILDSGLLRDKSLEVKAIAIEKALAWFVLPTRILANFGDTDERDISRSARVAEMKYLSEDMRYWVTGGEIGALPDKTSICFKESGYWIARDQEDGVWSYLAMQGGFHSRTHKHADDLSIIWYDQNFPILIDSGRYGYEGKTKRGTPLFEAGFWYADPWRMYCESTRAHNTLEFDVKDYPRRGVKPYGSALRECGEKNGIYYASAQCVHFQSIRHIRILFFFPRKWLIVLDNFFDREKQEHNVSQWFHLSDNLEIVLLENQYRISLPNDKNLLCGQLLDSAAPSRIYKGEKEPRLQGWWSPKDEKVIPSATFNFSINPATNGKFATIFTFSEILYADTAWNRVNASSGKGRFRWLDGFGRHELLFARSDGNFDLNYTIL